MNLLYLNSNILYGECLKTLEKERWRRNIKSGTVKRLFEKDFILFISILTKMEIVQRLVREEKCSVNNAREIFSNILKSFEITQISSINKLNLLTNTFIDLVMSSNLDFKDALHLDIASKNKLVVVTHDKKFRSEFSQHKDKLKFYSLVVKPEELFDY